jgi:hypothetical protein
MIEISYCVTQLLHRIQNISMLIKLAMILPLSNLRKIVWLDSLLVVAYISINSFFV